MKYAPHSPIVSPTPDSLLLLRCAANEVVYASLKGYSTPVVDLTALSESERRLTVHIEQAMQTACLLLTKSIEIIERTHALRSIMKAS